MKPLDLQINVNEIPDAGISVVETLPVEWIGAALFPAYTAVGEGKVEAEVTRMGENALVRGRVHARVAFDCSRTLEPAEIDLDVPFAELFVRNDTQDINLAEAEVSSDDLEEEPWVISGGVIDIEALVREHLMLAQDPYPLHPSQQRDSDEVDEVAPTTSEPLWSSTGDSVDPRWEALREIKLKD